ncbi:MAG: phosphoribosylamine--glycine ligase [Gammaproteobacteria bacterium]|nr:phosphoribosylamine--glycine ligase [Gammaproteobacteria bacterium]MCP4091627.1 phosphoribosylamine--glycine ligase [Gammaproteobacteria bacterium]MCP4276123.1 phosphoribosylamine--glycine ligase [Gammaproteobacteria bacterium]MCP4830867.1 phosphoribosylamine--glycine ligase [Gammaproteobacteria bacterium]MCP4929693.1 phosphoribosylamine--glycine ligase [Gammaproteobacteria bacterium]
MKILVVGSGGREHALAWALARSARVEEVIVAPGNAGTDAENKVRNIAISADDINGLLQLVQMQNIDLTVIGPEAPLVAGIVDTFKAAGLRCFGPTAAGAQLEGSKAYTKEFLERHNIPTAGYRDFTDPEAALAYAQECSLPTVVKADGLAAGKGVIIANTRNEATAAVNLMMGDKAFGDAGNKVVIEDFLVGEEASFMAIIDGEDILPLATSQDHKARDEGDKGPNTGGMGAYSPAPVIDTAMAERVMQEVMQPTVEGLKKDGEHYTGFLYAGLMIGDDGVPKVLEFNCRMGDPETQPILFRLKTDLVDLIDAALDHNLSDTEAEWDPRPALGVVLASGGYPDSYNKGNAISGLDADSSDEHLKIFHAGTKEQDGKVLTNGGRVLCCVALGDTVADAQSQAYGLVDQVSWDKVYCRRDIGYRAVKRGSS